MAPTLDEVFVSSALVRRELAKRGEGVVALSTMLDAVTIQPEAVLTGDRARHIFGELFVSQYDVTSALNTLFKKFMPHFQLTQDGSVGFTVTEEQAALLADGNWVCLFLPDIPFAILLEVFRALDVKFKEQWMRTLGQFISDMKPADGHDFLNRLCTVGRRSSASYVFLSREQFDFDAAKSRPDSGLFRFERVAFAGIWPVILLQLAMDRLLVRSCSYDYFLIRQDGSLAFAEKRSGESGLLGLHPLAIACPGGG